jgi:hypothetical protein
MSVSFVACSKWRHSTLGHGARVESKTGAFTSTPALIYGRAGIVPAAAATTASATVRHHLAARMMDAQDGCHT